VKPYYEDPAVVIYHGDAVAVLSGLESESVDVIFTDPPYSSGARNAAMLRARGSMRRNAEADDSWIANDNLTAHGFAMLVRLFGVESLARAISLDGLAPAARRMVAAGAARLG
jgi:DNA modification methylase